MSSPTQRSLAYLRAAGYLAEVTEQNVNVKKPDGKRLCFKKDLFGFVDILAVNGLGTLAVQTTSASNVAARVKKIQESPHLPRLLQAKWRIEVHGWKKGRRGEPRVVEIGGMGDDDGTREVRLDI